MRAPIHALHVRALERRQQSNPKGLPSLHTRPPYPPSQPAPAGPSTPTIPNQPSIPQSAMLTQSPGADASHGVFTQALDTRVEVLPRRRAFSFFPPATLFDSLSFFSLLLCSAVLSLLFSSLFFLTRVLDLPLSLFLPRALSLQCGVLEEIRLVSQYACMRGIY